MNAEDVGEFYFTDGGEESEVFIYASNIYENKYKDLCGDDESIHWSVQFGENVKVGFGTVIEKDCKIGDNTIIAHNCVLRPNTIVGKNCMVGHCSVLEGDTVIGNRVVIHAQCHITKGIVIEDEVWIGPMVTSTNTKYIVHSRKNMPLEFAPPTIRKGARVGAASKLFPGVEIGEDAFVGMGSLVTKSVPARQLWMGTPAKYFRDVNEKEWLCKEDVDGD